MKHEVLIFTALMAVAPPVQSPTKAQDEVSVDSSSAVAEVIPPPELRDWTPFEGQFQLYANFDGEAGDQVPRVDILNDRQESCLFWMEKLGDTLYLFIVPPGYELKDSGRVRNRVDGLDDEFPLVVWAGTGRAAYWLSHDSSRVVLDTLLSAPFITTVQLHGLPDSILTLQLQGKNKNAKVLRLLAQELGDRAELIQLEEGFYRDIWFKVRRTIVQTWKTNETKIGTFLAFRCVNGQVESVAKILQEHRAKHAGAVH